MDESLVERIIARMAALNQTIADDPLLGEHYQVGHSFFCPRGADFSRLDREWFEAVVKTEIAPLVEEYWFDNRDRAREAVSAVLAPWNPPA
jgi:5-methylcytosine-specific restriction protein B